MSRDENKKIKNFFRYLDTPKKRCYIKKYTQEKGVKTKMKKQIINLITLNILLLLPESAVLLCG